MAAWWSGFDQHAGRYPAHCAQRQLWNALYLAAFASKPGRPSRQPLLQELAAVCPNLAELLASCVEEQPEPRWHGLPFEQRHAAQLLEGYGEVIPLVYWRALVSELHLQLSQPPTANTLWVEGGSILNYRVLDNVVSTLTAGEYGHKLDALVLDATPSPLLTTLLPHAESSRAAVEQHLRVTQISDSLLTSRHLQARGGQEAERVAAVVNALAGMCATTAVLGNKLLLQAGGAVATELDSSLGLAVGWFGRDEKAHNRWTGARRLVIAGHHQLPPAEVQARAAMLRRHAGLAASNEAAGELRVLRPYQYRAVDGSGGGYWMRAYSDPLEQAIALHSEQATIQQAIGWVRGVLADRWRPVEVYLLTATPVADL